MLRTKAWFGASMIRWLSILLAMGSSILSAAAESPRITQDRNLVTLRNDEVAFEFDLGNGTYRLFSDAGMAISGARMKINEWASDAPGMKRSWSRRDVEDANGEGLALDLKFQSPDAPDLLFSVALYQKQNFFSLAGGIVNSTGKALRVRDIHVMADAVVHEGIDLTDDFAMIDGFTGGEPLEYGERFYSPLTRSNALKSRNNILLTFREDEQRRVMVMGGLSYHDFEKFATIAQERRVELERGRDGKRSLLCYLDLPKNRSDRAQGGERLELTKGSELRTWQYHEFRCSELATAVKEAEKIVVTAGGLKPDRPYTLGFSWWQGLWHGKHPDLTQSVFVEFEQDGAVKRLPLVENYALPRFDGHSKEDVEQVEMSLPPEAVRAENLRIVVEKAAGAEDEKDPHVYLNEIWLRDGRSESLLSGTLTPVKDSPRPRRRYAGQLFATDPVGKGVAPGQRYLPPDRFYIDVTGSDPFLALERYARQVRQAQEIELSMYDFPTVCMWFTEDHRYGNSDAENTSKGAVDEMKRIADSGFLNYSRAAVRLVPDSYMPDNQQGWWDDEHWQRDDTNQHTTQNGRYVEPYETSEKWGGAVTALGGVPLTYFQTAYRSEDYAAAFPGHMLFNKRYAWKGEPVDTKGGIFTSWEKTWHRNGRIVWGYDFTDPAFLTHMREVYANLKKGGIQGLMFDYPASGWAKAGGMEDENSTTAAAYRTIFRLAHEGLGPEAYVHERAMERGTDLTLGLVASIRTENDTDRMDGATVTRCGLRWYKNRVLVNHDADGKNLVRLEDDRDQVRAILTMSYVTTGRLLLANSFSQFSPETLRDLTRTFPYHTAPKSARPVDAFVADSPAVYDFEVNPEWHQVTFFNADKEKSKSVGIDISGPQVGGALGLDPERDYYLYDFWNDRFLGKRTGTDRIEEILRPGEARMISVRACLDRPQVLSTDRHLMQGYLDLSEVEWDEERRMLSGVSQVVGGDPYRVTLATNGHVAKKVSCDHEPATARLNPAEEGLAGFTLTSPENAAIRWSVSFR